MLGDRGPLQFVRTTTVLGSAPPSRHPLRDEFDLLDATNPRKLSDDERAFLATFGVIKSSGLGPDPVLLLLGEPHLVERNGRRLVVSSVLNSEVKSWGRARDTQNSREFTDQSTDAGYYPGHPLVEQYYVHSEEDGVNFYNYITAGVVNDGILFNTHSPGFGQSVFHELLHTFEGSNLTSSTYLKEGIVEKYSRLFAMKVYGLAIPIFAPYSPYYEEAEKLIRLTSLDTVARAYFGDDRTALEQLVPYFYEHINATLPAGAQLDRVCVQQAAGAQTVKGYFSPHKMREKNSWYRAWVDANGGAVPTNGLALPAAVRPPGFAPPPGMPGPLQPPGGPGLVPSPPAVRL